MDIATLNSAAEAARAGIRALASDIHAHPELAFEETRSAALLADRLEAEGFAVERGVASLPTAFAATLGSGELHVGLFLEYDALPGVGHACGHNLILGAGLTAVAALRDQVDALGITLQVLGTPAEEKGGGKIFMLEEGVFDDLHLAVMIHTVSEGAPYNPLGYTSQSIARSIVTYTGRGAHAAAAPWHGVNAADALLVAQVALGLLRQQLPTDHRVSCRTLEAGQATNIICDKAVAEFEFRAGTMEEHEVLAEKVRRCFEAGALAAGCEMTIEQSERTYEPLLQDPMLSAAWAEGMAAFGYDTTPRTAIAGGSTDFGNVSQVIPAIHPWVSLPGVHDPIHTEQYAQVADTDIAYEVMHHAGLAMAHAVAAVAQDGERRGELLTRRTRDGAPSARVRRDT